ncbi:hypothetical protein [Mariniblastus fucicola]|uniref:Uncharacterized protein n=1 Tax=Mariniblastus fucicola TaxID=980251 RepID=A0A5B9PEA1_9BACT|nr:hypothetical protein [Mariniblastus fucicola]QEG23829.1 hypothetical protein MFFC18_37330 [Mariniblastus fucicola]
MDGEKSTSLKWLWCIVLALPSLLPLAMHFHFANSADEFGTGFIQNDQPYYMANAREHFDAGKISLTYKNPNDWRRDSPRIYFQPQTLFLGFVQKFTGADPALIFAIFGFVFAVLTVRVAWSLLLEFVPRADDSWFANLAMFIWGGGLFAVAGLATMLIAPQSDLALYDYLTMYDPFQGWWFLNLGRNLVFPMEAWYHFLFLGGALMLARGKHFAAIAIGLLISISHPFTGVEFLAIMTAWLFLERIFWQQKSTSWISIAASLVLLVLHVGYYQVWLGTFPTHRELHEVWELAWELKAVDMILGYGLVAAFAFWTCRSSTQSASFLSQSKHRLLVVWFAVAFLLANHEFFMKSVQPLHFTRGYVWMPLFLIGASSLQRLTQYFNDRGPFKYATWVLVLLMLLDNATWLSVCSIDGRHNSAHSKTDFRAVMAVLNEAPRETTNEKLVVVSNSRLLSYLATTYTPHDAFCGHGYLTPDVQQSERKVSALISGGAFIESLDGYPQLVVLDFNGPSVDTKTAAETKNRLRTCYEENGYEVAELESSDSFAVFQCTPAVSRQQLGNSDEN